LSGLKQTIIATSLAGFYCSAPIPAWADTIRSLVSFQTRPLDMLRNSIGDEVSLDIAGISAIDKNIAFLYGRSSLGSLLLRTQDGG
jgi:hypothetical protein